MITALTPERRNILWACWQHWLSVPDVSPSERQVCYSWVKGIFEDRFGHTFRQTELHQLANLGYLKPKYTVRGGDRRYYSFPNPELVRRIVEQTS